MNKRFTPQVILRMRAMAGAGDSAAVIAREIGSTAASVRVKCSLLGIKLARGNAIGRRVLEAGILQIKMSEADFEVLQRIATERSTFPAVLVRNILSTVLHDDLVRAVLDE